MRDIQVSADYFRIAAELGEIEAFFKLGHFYLNGALGFVDRGKATAQFKAAAAKGFAPAQFQLGQIIMADAKNDGYLKTAVKYFKLAAKNGLADAQYKYAMMLSIIAYLYCCLLYTSPSPRDRTRPRMPSSA